MRLFGQGAYKADGKHFWLVTSEPYAANNTVSIVKDAGGHLDCSCPNIKPCKHIAFIAHHLNEQRKEAPPAPPLGPLGRVLLCHLPAPLCAQLFEPALQSGL